MSSIIHLSDLHLGVGSNAAHARALISHIIETHDPAWHAVVITGDVIETPNAKLYTLAQRLLMPLVDAGFSVFMVPGNHDLFPRGIDFGGLTSAAVLHWRALRRVICPAPESESLPLLWRFGGRQIVGLDTMAGSSDDWEVDLAQGRVGEQQLAALSAVLEHGAVVLGHHRVWWDDAAHRLEDAKALHNILDPRASLYLCGHQHKHNDLTVGLTRYIAAPRTTQRHEGALRYQVIDLEAGDVRWEGCG